MFEEKTFENIMQEMLAYVENINPELDISVGSMIYTAIAPIALELETAYHNMAMIMDETFLTTASKEYLVQLGNEFGLEIIPATYTHVKGRFNKEVPIGSRFNLDKFNYSVLDQLDNESGTNGQTLYCYELACETAGVEPNSYCGDIIPITYIGGLTFAEIVSPPIIYGEDEEDTETFRYRLQLHVQEPPISANVSQYIEWLEERAGVGSYKVLPCWNGVNTVKLLILTPENTIPTSEFVASEQAYFDPPIATINDDITDNTYPQGRGMGNGVAPIGAIVTVSVPDIIEVTINCTVQLEPGYTEATGVEEKLNDYLLSNVFKKNVINYHAVSAAIYNTDSVKDITSLQITVGGTTVTPTSEVTIDGEAFAELSLTCTVED